MEIDISNGFLLRMYRETGELESQSYEFKKIVLLCSVDSEESNMHYYGIDTRTFTTDKTPKAAEFIATWRRENHELNNTNFSQVDIPSAYLNVYIVPYRGRGISGQEM